jgi:hypothetical protein
MERTRRVHRSEVPAGPATILAHDSDTIERPCESVVTPD